jgi:predicted acylesterase/phospholipase RssA
MSSKSVLILSGGGPRGVIQLGALDYMYRIKQLKKYRTIVGTDIGAIIAILIACRFSPREIYDSLFSESTIYNIRPNMSLASLSKGHIYNIANFISPIEELIVKKLGAVPTLQQLHDNSYDVYLATANLTTAELEYLSHENYPNLRATDALKLACSTPFLYDRVHFQGSQYCNASINDNVSILFPKRYEPEDIESILCVDVSGVKQYSKEKRVDSFLAQLQNLIHFNPLVNQQKNRETALEIFEDKLVLIEFTGLANSNIFSTHIEGVECPRMFSYGSSIAASTIGVEVGDIQQIDTEEQPQPVFPSEDED